MSWFILVSIGLHIRTTQNFTRNVLPAQVSTLGSRVKIQLVDGFKPRNKEALGAVTSFSTKLVNCAVRTTKLSIAHKKCKHWSQHWEDFSPSNFLRSTSVLKGTFFRRVIPGSLVENFQYLSKTCCCLHLLVNFNSLLPFAVPFSYPVGYGRYFLLTN